MTLFSQNNIEKARRNKKFIKIEGKTIYTIEKKFKKVKKERGDVDIFVRANDMGPEWSCCCFRQKSIGSMVS